MNRLSDRAYQPALWMPLFAFSALACCVSANAGTLTSTWRAPTLYTDGSTITSPVTYRMEVGPEGQAASQSVISSATTASVPNLAPGRWCSRIYAVVNGVESDPTSPSCVSVPGAVAKKPNPAYAVSTTAAP